MFLKFVLILIKQNDCIFFYRIKIGFKLNKIVLVNNSIWNKILAENDKLEIRNFQNWKIFMEIWNETFEIKNIF